MLCLLEALDADCLISLMALIELASDSIFDCTGLVACVSRTMDAAELKGLLRDLGWVGFNLITLDRWAKVPAVTSDKWLVLRMEL